jgi:hypothetical protein
LRGLFRRQLTVQHCDEKVGDEHHAGLHRNLDNIVQALQVASNRFEKI